MTKLKTLRWGDILDFQGAPTYPGKREVEEDCTTGGDLTSSAKRDLKVLPLALKMEEGATAKVLPLGESSSNDCSTRHQQTRRQILP